MTKEFLNSTEVAVVNSYLSKVVESGKVAPIYNHDFIIAQQQAEWVITFAEKAKGKDFIGKEADSIESVKEEVIKELGNKDTQYLKTPELPKQKLQNQLASEALNWIKGNEEIEKTQKINSFMQRFNTINEFEEVGLFFEQDIIKLAKIYTIKEITEAVKEIIDLLVK